MTTNIKSNSIIRKADNQALQAGLLKHASTFVSFIVGGQVIKTADVVTALQADSVTLDVVTAAHAAWQEAVENARQSSAKTVVVVRGVKQAIRLQFAGQVGALSDFGMKPPKTPTPRTPEEKAASAAKAKATRAARKTMGPVAKQKVKGNVTGVTVTPLTVPEAAAGNPAAAATPVATSAPAPAAPAAPRAS